ncbi:MAG: NAD-dependent epimerase/dehydratase family protein [Chloroflexi bacterium]|nr:NAD-dependent epimerase/dehydratase family protein [Chloroflexota bacterium]
MKIIVTGAAGFIGSHLAERLADLGHEVVGIDAFTDYYSQAWKETNAEGVQSRGVSLHRLDLAEDELTAVLHNANFIYHLAGQPGISATTSFETYVRNNMVATHRLLKASSQLPTLKCFVNISTSSVYGAHAADSEATPPKPTSYYGVTKLAAEQLVLARQREQGFPGCSTRIFSVYGPRERPEKLYPKLIRSILMKEPFPLYEGSEHHSRSFTFVSDIVDGFVTILRNPKAAIGEIFNIGSDREMTTGDGIRIIEDIMGQKATMNIIPKRPGDQLRTCANIEKAGRLLGYEPKTRLEDGLRAEVEWYKEKIFGRGIH